MKKIVCALLLVLFAVPLSAQSITITFEDSIFIAQKIRIDTLNYPANKWQIGKPVKPVFNMSYSLPKAIVTDTLNLLPPSDTSVFYLNVFRPYSFPPPSFVIAVLRFSYKLNKAPGDQVIIEVSPDTGGHWVNLMTEDSVYAMTWYGMKPDFSLNNNTWTTFSCNFSQWFSDPYTGPFPYFADADTFRFRFTFITDSVAAPREGMMIDDLQFTYAVPEGIGSGPEQAESVFLYPNPGHQVLQLSRSYSNGQQEVLWMFGMDGRCVFEQEVSRKESIQVNLPPGLYLVQYRSGENVVQQKLLIE